MIGVRDPCQSKTGRPDLCQLNSSLLTGLIDRLSDVKQGAFQPYSKEVCRRSKSFASQYPIMVNDHCATTSTATVDPQPIVSDYGTGVDFIASYFSFSLIHQKLMP